MIIWFKLETTTKVPTRAGTSNKFANPCPVGTYLPDIGATSSAACLPCKEGFACNDTGRYFNVYCS